jgi:hypothetical protein
LDIALLKKLERIYWLMILSQEFIKAVFHYKKLLMVGLGLCNEEIKKDKLDIDDKLPSINDIVDIAGCQRMTINKDFKV